MYAVEDQLLVVLFVAVAFTTALLSVISIALKSSVLSLASWAFVIDVQPATTRERTQTAAISGILTFLSNRGVLTAQIVNMIGKKQIQRSTMSPVPRHPLFFGWPG